VVNKPYKPSEVEIRDVTRFSYGQTTDGDMMIWALGSAGWFEIRPSKSYESIYKDMVQAVEILYFVTDVYNEPRKRGGGPSSELIFMEYAEDERFACKTKEEAEAIFYKHRAFLIMCFLNRAQGLGWSNTPIYQFFKRKFTKEFEASKARVDGKLDAKSEKLTRTSSPAAAAKSTTKAKGKEKEKAKSKVLEAPKKDDNWWESAGIFEFVQKAVNQNAVHKGHITIERVAKLLVKRYEIDDVDTAQNVIIVHGQNLCYMMENPRRKNTEYFASEPIYAELSSGHNLSAADVRRAEGVELKPRKDHGTLKEDASSSSEDSSSDDASTRTPPRRRSGKEKSRGQLSVLRPKSSKYSGAGKGKGPTRGKGKGKKNVPIHADDESSSADDTGIDTPTQAPSPGKRKLATDTKEHRPRKRAASDSVSASPESAPSSLSSTPEADAVPDPPLPLRWRDKHTAGKGASPALLPPLVSTPLPTYAANAPGDVWICTFDGCSQKMYGASSDEGGMLIHEHLEDHSRGRAFEIGIVMSEESRLRLPVRCVLFSFSTLFCRALVSLYKGQVLGNRMLIEDSNLIKRIREMAERQQQLFPTGAPMRPTPIERTV
jgi:hypothetical protein